MTVPVLGVPCLNRPELLDGMLATVDHPVEHLYLVDNGDVLGYRTLVCPQAEAIRVVAPGCNLGVAESWNLIIRANLHAPWVLIVNSDIEFAPGALARLVETMDGHDDPLVATLFGYGAFAVNAAAIEKVGWYDPTFSPIYYEDSDWQRRALLLGVGHVHIHSETTHGSEQSHQGDAALAARNAQTRYANREAYERKWGTTVVGEERYGFPYDGHMQRADEVVLPPLSWLRSQSWDAQ